MHSQTLASKVFISMNMQESRTYWFNAASVETDEEFMLIGLVLGLAIYNAVLLDFPLPQALYRKLLGQGCTLRDLSDMDPTLGRSLGQLLAYDGTFSPLLHYIDSACIQDLPCSCPNILKVMLFSLLQQWSLDFAR